MNPSTSRSNSQNRNASAIAATALRPRVTKRLLSGLDEPSLDQATSSYQQPVSPFISRAASPIPSKHPSRSCSINPPPRRAGPSTTAQGDPVVTNTGNELALQLSGLWGKSWTNLQGLASNILGSDISGEMVKDKSSQRQRRPFEATHRAQLQPAWGPKASEASQPGAGSREERKAKVREQKRQDMLTGNGHLTVDSARHKRRTSDEFESVSAPPSDVDDRDALVYIHRVTSYDTLAGISIKFNVQLAVLKKANRMFTDNVQTRKTLVIPVDSCGVRGRPVTASTIEEEDCLLTDCVHNNDTLHNPTIADALMSPIERTSSISTIKPPTAPVSIAASSTPSSPRSRQTEEPLWRHDSWVRIDSHNTLVEIARLSRRDLGYFPRARRKSLSYSDLDTPSISLDLPRPVLSATDSSTNATSPGHRKRRSSSSNQWAQQMIGPGGVGTLAGKGVSAPGPAEDKLTKVLRKNIPNLVPSNVPREDYDDEDDSLRAAGAGIEALGGAIEGWARKLAKTAAKALEQPAPSRGARQQRQKLGLGSSGGDLIELSNAFEIGLDDEIEDAEEEQMRGRAREPTPTLHAQQWQRQGAQSAQRGQDLITGTPWDLGGALGNSSGSSSKKKGD